jgi:hypothetical protein
MHEGSIGIEDFSQITPVHYLIEIGDSKHDLECGLGIHASE